MAGPHTLPIHIGDYVKTTPSMGPETFEYHGIYFALLFSAWNVPKCRLPTDDLWIARRLGCPIDFYNEKVRPILVEHFKRRGKWWYQDRLSTECERVATTSQKQRERAKCRNYQNKDECRGDALPDSNSNGKQQHKHKDFHVGEKRRLGAKPQPTTIKDPLERLRRFQNNLLPELGPTGPAIIAAALDPDSLDHAKAVRQCQDAATRLKKRWPTQWHVANSS